MGIKYKEAEVIKIFFKIMMTYCRYKYSNDESNNTNKKAMRYLGLKPMSETSAAVCFFKYVNWSNVIKYTY